MDKAKRQSIDIRMRLRIDRAAGGTENILRNPRFRYDDAVGPRVLVPAYGKGLCREHPPIDFLSSPQSGPISWSALRSGTGPNRKFMAWPREVEQRSRATLRENLVKIGAKVVSHGRYVTFQLAEVAVQRELFRTILSLVDDLRPRPAPAQAGAIDGQVKTTGRGCLNDGKSGQMAFQNESRSPNSGRRMATEGLQSPWRWNGSTSFLNLGVILEMSVS